jgi:hypothetical protein
LSAQAVVAPVVLANAWSLESAKLISMAPHSDHHKTHFGFSLAATLAERRYKLCGGSLNHRAPASVILRRPAGFSIPSPRK